MERIWKEAVSPNRGCIPIFPAGTETKNNSWCLGRYSNQASPGCKSQASPLGLNLSLDVIQSKLPTCAACVGITVDQHVINTVACRPVAGQRPRDKQNYKQPLLSKGVVNKHVFTATIRNSNRGTVFSVPSVPRCYKQGSWSNELKCKRLELRRGQSYDRSSE
jgi:hypothetical protein